MSDHQSIDALLDPSLSQKPSGQAPYSTKATYLVSFFGGIMGAAAMGAVNAYRLKRPSWELVLAALFFLAGMGVLFQLSFLKSHEDLPEILAQNQRIARYANQGLGLLISGFFFLLQKRARAAFDLAGGDEPRPWGMGLGVIAIATVFGLLAHYLGAQL